MTADLRIIATLSGDIHTSNMNNCCQKSVRFSILRCPCSGKGAQLSDMLVILAGRFENQVLTKTAQIIMVHILKRVRPGLKLNLV